MEDEVRLQMLEKEKELRRVRDMLAEAEQKHKSEVENMKIAKQQELEFRMRLPRSLSFCMAKQGSRPTFCYGLDFVFLCASRNLSIRQPIPRMARSSIAIRLPVNTTAVTCCCFENG